MPSRSHAIKRSASALLDAGRLATLLGPLARRFDVDSRLECDSTNSVLLAQIDAPSGRVLVADRQLAGRGRRGRTWVSEAPSGLSFSFLWRFSRRPAAMPGLSLAVGVAVARALAGLGHADIALKWPNDLLRRIEGGWGKLGGVLVEIAAEPEGTLAVIGIGLNLQAPTTPIVAALPPVGLADGAPAERHVVLAAILAELAATVDRFEAGGFPPFIAEWQRWHAFAGCRVRLEEAGRVHGEGRCVGVDADGALLVDTDSGRQRWLSGDLSLRPA